ncbi:MAG: LytTR family transcriptional regulator [Flavobacteriales bacterium]|nr:LytTR family transcriptional regulator [Flavobacteriales bacterium]MBP7156004.1 LytTR family transcriptional regulator [Flavobacteriales bacterium]HQW40693.1 LytTR family DNA-binding domain-containing protein [Flavobacteriales bacterium]
MSKATVFRTTGRNRSVAGTKGRIVEFHSELAQRDPEPIQVHTPPRFAFRSDQLEEMLGSILHKLLNGASLPAAYSGHSRSGDHGGPQRIAIPDLRGIEMLRVDSILCAVAFSNYTELHLHGGHRLVISRTLKDIEADLPVEWFIRIHASHLVALSAITRYIRGNGGIVVLANGEQFPVSRAKKDELLERLGAH